MIPLVAPMITQSDQDYLRDRISDDLLSSDREVRLFEERFSSRLGVAGAVAVNSGTSALQLALLALGAVGGAEVVFPSYTCVALLNACHACGAVPVLVDNGFDVSRARFHLDLAEARSKISARTRAIIVPHMFGTVAEIGPYLGDVPVVEDFTLSLGALAVGGRTAGSLGTIGVCSLHESKMISCGRGGIVVSDDEVLLARVRRLADYDGLAPSWRLESTERTEGRYEPAYSFGMTSMQAALGNSQLSQFDLFLERRLALATRYTNRFELAGIDCPEVPGDGSNVFFRYLIAAPGRVERTLRSLSERGIEGGRGVYPPLHMLLGLGGDGFPGAARCAATLLSVPVHPSITDDEADYVAESFVQATER